MYWNGYSWNIFHNVYAKDNANVPRRNVMGKLNDIWQEIKQQLSISKTLLKNKWDEGAEQGKILKEKHKKIIKKEKDGKDEK